MSVVAKALWVIESHLNSDLTLAGIAGSLGVTPFHLSRAFSWRTGQPVMRYVRRRRLAQAALALSDGGGRVIEVALDAGYGSPEAFSRAFRGEFGLPPSDVRTAAAAAALRLMQPIQMNGVMTMKLAEPKVEEMGARVIVGPERRYDMQTRVEIPAQWVAYNADSGREETGGEYFGVVHGFSDEGTFAYLCGQEARGRVEMPKGFSKVTVPAGRYARFVVPGHISTIGDAWGEIYEHWTGRPGLEARQGPSLEFYPEAFDGMTGDGGFELWVPVA